MKIKGSSIKAYFGMIWWAITQNKKYMLIECCERCGSVSIERSNTKVVYDSDGHSNYYAKYFCRRCGASAIAKEIWSDDNLVDFKYNGERKRGCGCCIINPEDNKILLGLRCKPGDKAEWCFVGGTVEDTERPHEAIFREIKEECGLTAGFVQHVTTLKSGEWDDYIYITNEFTGELVNQPEELSELKWFSVEELDAIPLYPATAEAIEALKAKGALK